MIFVACGTQDTFYEQTCHNVEIVKEKGVPIVTYFEKGRHDWTFWRHCAYEFLMHVFKIG